MDLGLTDKIVVVTGASKGIGFACAAAFAGEGARVILVSRSAANLEAARAKFPASRHAPQLLVADLVDAGQASRLIDQVESEIGAIDVLVNSAGAARRSAPADLDAAAWHAAMDAKYFSYIHPLDAVLKRMAVRGRGAVVNIIGSGGKVANPVHLPGGAANAALMLASTGLAVAFAPKGISRAAARLSRMKPAPPPMPNRVCQRWTSAFASQDECFEFTGSTAPSPPMMGGSSTALSGGSCGTW